MKTAGKKTQPPSLLLEKPHRARVPGYCRKVLVCMCDDGMIYTLAALAKMAGIKYHTIVTRIRTYGFDSPLILLPKAESGKTINGEDVITSTGQGGNEAWAKLSARPRTERLARLRQPGSFEKRGETQCQEI